MIIEKFLNNIRNSNIVCSYIPIESSMGLPVPIIKNKKLCFSVPFFENNEKNTIVHVITATYDYGTVVEYKNLSFCEEIEIINSSSKNINNISEKEYLKNKLCIYKLYDKYIECLKKDLKPEGEWYKNFCTFFINMVGNEHLEYYNYINPDFFSEIIKNAKF